MVLIFSKYPVDETHSIDPHDSLIKYVVPCKVLEKYGLCGSIHLKFRDGLTNKHERKVTLSLHLLNIQKLHLNSQREAEEPFCFIFNKGISKYKFNFFGLGIKKKAIH